LASIVFEKVIIASTGRSIASLMAHPLAICINLPNDDGAKWLTILIEN
jgi:hypothetical protein